MKKKAATSLGLLLSAAIVFTGCSGGNKSGQEKATAEPSASNTAAAATEASGAKTLDTSKHVNLQFYMLGDEPKDMSVIEAEVNKLAEKDLNATVKFNFTTWTDWDQKYKLLLSSGQQVDLIFTADWTSFQSYAKKGAFLPLDELLPTAAHELQKFVPQDMWDAVKIDGKIYTVPSTYKEYVTHGFVYREDLREKYNLPKPTSLETYEQYLDGIKKNEPNLIPIGSTGYNHVPPYLNLKYKTIANNGLPYGLMVTYDQPDQVVSYWGSPQHLEDLKTYKRWMDKGFWSRNVLNMNANDLLVSGKAASDLGVNPSGYNDMVLKLQSLHPDWKLDYYPFPLSLGYATPVHPIHNGFAIPKSSVNPERALAFYEKLVTDKRYNRLTEYGIEGKNFEVDSDGYYKMLGDSASNGFPREAMNGWAWRNPQYMLFDKGYDGVKAIFSELDKIEKPDKFTGFAEDWTPYQAEKAALEQVEKQYLGPLNVGLVPDVEAGLNKFMEKAKQAGLEKIQEEYKKQWLQYVNEKGIK